MTNPSPPPTDKSKPARAPTPIPVDESALLRVDHVTHLTGCGRTTIWRKVRDGDFPRPVRLGRRAVAWPRKVVLEWIASRPTA